MPRFFSSTLYSITELLYLNFTERYLTWLHSATERKWVCLKIEAAYFKHVWRSKHSSDVKYFHRYNNFRWNKNLLLERLPRAKTMYHENLYLQFLQNGIDTSLLLWLLNLKPFFYFETCHTHTRGCSWDFLGKWYLHVLNFRRM